MMAQQGIRIVTLNVRGLNNVVKRKRVTSYLLQLNANIIVLQETHLTSSETSILKMSKYQQQFHSPGSSKSRGVAILFLNNFRFDCKNTEVDPKDRYIFVKGFLEGQNTCLGLFMHPIQLNCLL